jgi:hypothetical protein
LQSRVIELFRRHEPTLTGFELMERTLERRLGTSDDWADGR